LKKLRKDQSEGRLPAMDHYLDEKTGQIKSRPLSPSDMAASALTVKTVNQYKNPAKLIHQLIFGY
jgi:hypothetical protein